MKALAQPAIEQHVDDRTQRHALMMRHKSTHHGKPGALRHARARVVERLIETEAPERPEPGKTGKIGYCRRRIDHRCQGRRIGSDDCVLA